VGEDREGVFGRRLGMGLGGGGFWELDPGKKKMEKKGDGFEFFKGGTRAWESESPDDFGWASGTKDETCVKRRQQHQGEK